MWFMRMQVTLSTGTLAVLPPAPLPAIGASACLRGEQCGRAVLCCVAHCLNLFESQAWLQQQPAVHVLRPGP